MYYRERLSALAIASLILGILSLLLFPLYRIAFPMVVVNTLLGIGAIVTGVIAMRRTAIYPLRGRTPAYIGIVTGANGLFWIWINTVFRLIG